MREHWFDQLARDAVERRLSRRQMLVRGARLLAGVAVGGGAYGLRGPRALAQGSECSSVASIPPDCYAAGQQAQEMAQAACAAERGVNYVLCQQGVPNAYWSGVLQCLKDDGRRIAECGKCRYCLYGTCTSICAATCLRCDPSTETCFDTCPPDQYCSPTASNSGGACVPKCQQPCAPYDPALNACRDLCAEANPCMSCYQNICQSNCPDDDAPCCQDSGVCGRPDPDQCQHVVATAAYPPLEYPHGPVCRGCDPNCEKCEDGSCVNLCPAGQVCCFGQCEDCCGGICDPVSGKCTGKQCSGGTPYCVEGTCSACTTGVYPDPAYKQCGPAGESPYSAFEEVTCCPPGQECCAYRNPKEIDNGIAPPGEPWPWVRCYDPSAEFCCPTGGPCQRS